MPVLRMLAFVCLCNTPMYSLLVNGLHELADDERHALDALDFLLCPHELALQTPLLVLDVLLLQVNVSGGLLASASAGRHFELLTLAAVAAF